jgi:hypothetical protein
MTLDNMRANGVRLLDVCWWLCHHRAIMSAEPWPVGNMRANGVRWLDMSCSVLSVDRWPDACRCRSRVVRHRRVIVGHWPRKAKPK